MVEFSKLYLYINKYLNTPALPFDFDALLNREAYLHNLSGENVPFKEKELGNNIRLQAHHISLDKHIDKANPAMSAYHYTAYFTDGNNFWQLHVYFGADDKPSCCQLSKKTSAGDWERVSISEGMELSFIELAKQNTQGFIRQLRSAHLKQIQEDLSQLKTLDEELIGLSINLQENREAYLKKIKEAIELLESIQSYHEDSDYCLILLTHFKRIQQNLSARPLAPSFFSPQANVQEEDRAPLELELTSEKTESPSQKRMSEKTSLLQAVDAASAAYQAFIQSINDPKVSAKERISFLLKSIEATQALNELSVRARYIVELPVLEKTRMLMQKNEAGRLQLLELLLAGGKITEAKSLPLSLRSLPQGKAASLVYLALAKANKELLQFILEHNALPINDLSMPNKQSLVMYCFGLQDKPGIAACLSLLVKHGASLTELEPTQNLPLAHLILSDIQHPFQHVINDNKERTIDNRQFFKEIIRLIEKHQPLSDLIRARSLEAYKDALETLKSSRVDKKLISSTRQAFTACMQCFSSEVMLFLRFDEEVQEKNAEFNVAANFYYDNISSNEKNSLDFKLKGIAKSDTNLDFLNFISKKSLKNLALLVLDTNLAKIEAHNAEIGVNKLAETKAERKHFRSQQRKWLAKANELDKQCASAFAAAINEGTIAQLQAMTDACKKLAEKLDEMAGQVDELSAAQEKDAWLAEHPEEEVIDRFSFYGRTKPKDALKKDKDNGTDDEFDDVPDFLDCAMGMNG